MIEQFEYDHFYIDDDDETNSLSESIAVFSLISTDNRKELLWKTPPFTFDDYDSMSEKCVKFATSIILTEPLTVDELLLLSQEIFAKDDI